MNAVAVRSRRGRRGPRGQRGAVVGLGQRGQSTLELAGTLGLVLVALIGCLQLTAYVVTERAAERACRSAVRAGAIGLDPQAAARSSLEDWARPGAVVDAGPGRATVTVRVPVLLPVWPSSWRSVSRSLDVGQS